MPKWMLLEDDEDLHSMLLMMFQLWGIDGIAFNEGDEAYDWIESLDRGEYLGEAPVLAFLDIRMKRHIDGIMVGERIRKSPKLKNIAIVLMSAFLPDDKEVLAAVDKVQANGFVPKPLPKFAELKVILEDIVKKHKETASADDTAAHGLVKIPLSSAVTPAPKAEEPVPKTKKTKTKKRRFSRVNPKNKTTGEGSE